MQKVEALIIGGGISGLACGNKLNKAGKDFLLLTKEMGGRMMTSEDGGVNYGAVYVTDDYENMLRFARKRERVRIKDFYFRKGTGCRNLFSDWKLILQAKKLVRLLFVISDFNRRMKRFRYSAVHIGQKESLRNDPVLSAYLSERAEDFVKRMSLDYLNEEYFNPVLCSTIFINYKETSALYYLGALMPLLTRTFEADLSDTVNGLTVGWGDKIRIETVDNVKNADGGYMVSTSSGEYFSENLVLALPYKDIIHLYNIPHLKDTGIPINVHHVSGERRDVFFGKKVIVLDPDSNDVSLLWGYRDGTDIMYSRLSEPDLSKYYQSHKIIRKVHWDTAVCALESDWVNQDMGDGLYLVSDYNISSLEDAFITGLYAANKIIAAGQEA